MEQEKNVVDGYSPNTKGPADDHIENIESNQLRPFTSYVDHRADDDRADEAKGRNSDKFEKNYWLSVNYIGTLFAIGMAFMGGIGGEFITNFYTCAHCHIRLWPHCTYP